MGYPENSEPSHQTNEEDGSGGTLVTMSSEQKDAWVVSLEALRTENFPVAVKSFLFLGLDPEGNDRGDNPQVFIPPFTYCMAALSATLLAKDTLAQTKGYLEGLSNRTHEKYSQFLEAEEDEYLHLLQLAAQQIPDVLVSKDSRHAANKVKVRKIAIDHATYHGLALLATIAQENNITGADMLDIAESYMQSNV